MKIYGQIKEAQLEVLSADPSNLPVSRVWFDKVTNRVRVKHNSASENIATETYVDAHINDATDAHDASAISNVAAGNIAATNVQDALNELQTDIDTRATSAALSAHEADTSTHGVAVVAGLSEVQAFTNKDIDGGTASNTLRLTVPKNTKANLDALTRKAATVVYGTDTNKLYADNGTILKAIGGSFEIVANAAQTNATTLTPGSGSAQVLQISGNGGAVTLTDLGITNAQDGDQLILAGTSDTNTVTLIPATNTVMNGGATLGDGNMITFLYFNSKYREQSRNF